MSAMLLPAEQGIRVLFGKPYHWHPAYDGKPLHLVAGPHDDCLIRSWVTEHLPASSPLVAQYLTHGITDEIRAAAADLWVVVPK